MILAPSFALFAQACDRNSGHDDATGVVVALCVCVCERLSFNDDDPGRDEVYLYAVVGNSDMEVVEVCL